MIRTWHRLVTGLAAIGVLLACDDPSGPSAGIDRGGVRTPVAAVGAITGFGSIIVNGVHYSLDTAEVRIDEALAAEADLKLGQVVAINGSRGEGSERVTADTVAALTNVQGPVTAVDVATGVFAVLGQTVRADADTVLDLGTRAPTPASLVVGETVRVSGFVASGGSIEAARVEQRAAAAELRVAGRVSRLSRSAMRFFINDLAVSYSAASVIDGFPNGQPSDGDEVVVTGSTVAPSGALLATTLVRRSSGATRSAGDEFEVEGLITRFVSPQDFAVAGIDVTTTAATTYEHGSAASLALDLKVHVSGRVNAALALEVRRVEIED